MNILLVMKRLVLAGLMAGVFSCLVGCGEKMDKTYTFESFKPSENQIAVHIQGLVPEQMGKIASVLQNFPEVQAETMEAHLRGELVFFSVQDPSSVAQVAEKVSAALTEAGLKVGGTKTP